MGGLGRCLTVMYIIRALVKEAFDVGDGEIYEGGGRGLKRALISYPSNSSFNVTWSTILSLLHTAILDDTR